MCNLHNTTRKQFIISSLMMIIFQYSFSYYDSKISIDDWQWQYIVILCVCVCVYIVELSSSFMDSYVLFVVYILSLDHQQTRMDIYNSVDIYNLFIQFSQILLYIGSSSSDVNMFKVLKMQLCLCVCFFFNKDIQYKMKARSQRIFFLRLLVLSVSIGRKKMLYGVCLSAAFSQQLQHTRRRCVLVKKKIHNIYSLSACLFVCLFFYSIPENRIACEEKHTKTACLAPLVYIKMKKMM